MTCSMGGMGEDWIFGGPGNDVISGGYDRQAPDLLFGEDGNDTFQLIPDDAAADGRLRSDLCAHLRGRTMYGGDGEDRVLFLGGDTDNLGLRRAGLRVAALQPDLHRYELTSLVWDTANQEFMTEVVPGAVIVGQGCVPRELGAAAIIGL